MSKYFINYNILFQLAVVLILIVHQRSHVSMEIVLTRVFTLIVVPTHYVALMVTIGPDAIVLLLMKAIHL